MLSSATATAATCFRCGKSDHVPTECFAIGVHCHFVGRWDISSECVGRNKQIITINDSKRRVSGAENTVRKFRKWQPQNKNGPYIQAVNSLRGDNDVNMVKTRFQNNDQILTSLVDTGARVSCIDQSSLAKVFPGRDFESFGYSICTGLFW